MYNRIKSYRIKSVKIYIMKERKFHSERKIGFFCTLLKCPADLINIYNM
uniref:Uncharacterized protein n=1 Tax=Lepeophtheirus salmonis TaxID=72036 RepID=A0A0K2T579_LEPSM